MARTRKVTGIPGTYAFEGKSYGPFEAANGKEFMEVPADFADAMGLPLHESELEAQAEAVDDDAVQVDAVIAERDHLKQVLFATAAAVLDRASYLRVPRGDAQYPEGMDVHQAVAAGFDDLKAELDKAHADFAHERQQHEKTREGYAKFSKESGVKVADLTARIQTLETESDTLAAQLAEAQAKLLEGTDGADIGNPITAPASEPAPEPEPKAAKAKAK